MRRVLSFKKGKVKDLIEYLKKYPLEKEVYYNVKIQQEHVCKFCGVTYTLYFLRRKRHTCGAPACQKKYVQKWQIKHYQEKIKPKRLARLQVIAANKAAKEKENERILKLTEY